VVTNGGLLGRITKVGDNFITLEVADGLESRSETVPGEPDAEGTMKTL